MKDSGPSISVKFLRKNGPLSNLPALDISVHVAFSHWSTFASRQLAFFMSCGKRLIHESRHTVPCTQITDLLLLASGNGS